MVGGEGGGWWGRVVGGLINIINYIRTSTDAF